VTTIDDRKNLCLICGGTLESEESRTIVTVLGRTLSAHVDCIEGMKKILGGKVEIPPTSEKTSKDLIYGFYLEGWFSSPRTLSDVSSKLMQSGFNFDASTIAHNLRDLTRAGILTRQGKRGNYEYVQKKPPQ
jgi:hypothetical protein